MKVLRYLDPANEIQAIDATLERLFQPWRAPLTPSHEATVPLAIFENEGNFIVRASVPGVNSDDLDISIEDGSLTIRGEFKQEAELAEAKVYRREYSYGAFTRTVKLPENVDAERVEAEFKNGFVTITLPKNPEEKPKTLKVPVKNA